MRKLIATIIVSSLILGGCSTVHEEKLCITINSASQYKGQGFQPVAEKCYRTCEKHREEYENLVNNFLKITLALMLKPQML